MNYNSTSMTLKNWVAVYMCMHILGTHDVQMVQKAYDKQIS